MSTFSDRLRLTKQATGSNTNTWGQVLNDSVIALLDDAIAGMSSVAISATDVTLSANNGAADQARNMILKCTGTLTNNRAVIVPAETKMYLVWNATGGAFNLTIKTSAGTGVVVPQNKMMPVFCDGTNVESLLHAVTSASADDITGLLAITSGGTGASTATAARTNLGLGALAILDTINNSLWSGADLAIEHGGTGASTASAARTNLGLGALAILSTINNSLWSGADLAIEHGGTGASTATDARTNLGLGALAILNTINNSQWSGTDLAIEHGGTGASTATDARTNLGLGALAILSTINNSLWSGTDLAIEHGGTGASTQSGARTNLGLGSAATEADTKYNHRANNLSDVSNTTTARSNLGLGSAATENVVPVAKGGTGETTFADARKIPVVSTSSAKTFALTDADSLNILTGTTGRTFTVPPNSSVAFPIGTSIAVTQDGTGQLTLAQGSGVTIRSPRGLKLREQYSMASITKTGTDLWRAAGDLVA